MKFQYMSDLHLEFGMMWAENTEKADVLILAGDIVPFKNFDKCNSFFLEACTNFADVLWVPGNHEYYHYDMADEAKFKEKLRLDEGYDNLHLLNKDTWTKGDVTVIGATLWTDLNDDDDIDSPNHPSYVADNFMNDTRIIKLYEERFKSPQWKALHREHLAFLRKELEARKNEKTVVVTHHAPTEQSIDKERYGDDMANYCYFTHLDYFLKELEPNVWVHGHTHTTADYTVGNTRVLSNQRGYTGYALNPSFAQQAVFEL